MQKSRPAVGPILILSYMPIITLIVQRLLRVCLEFDYCSLIVRLSLVEFGKIKFYGENNQDLDLWLTCFERHFNPEFRDKDKLDLL